MLINDIIDLIPPLHPQKIKGFKSIFRPLGKLKFKFRCPYGSYKVVLAHS